jgi:hypothetical protein
VTETLGAQALGSLSRHRHGNPAPRWGKHASYRPAARPGGRFTGHATDPKGSGVVGENSTIGATGFLGTAVQSQGKLIYCGVCGVAAATEEEKGSPVKGAGVFGSGGGNNDGIYGESGSGRGVFGFSENGDGVRGGTSAPSQDRSGVYGSGNDSNMGVHGDSFSGAGVYGASNWGIGVQG